MNIQPVNNVSFGQRVRFNKSVVKDGVEALSTALPVSSSSAGLSASGIGSTVIYSTGSGFNTVGSAFVSKASGLNSSGIVPSAMQSAGPHLTPATVASSNNNPSAMGCILSTIGGMFNAYASKITEVKKPS